MPSPDCICQLAEPCLCKRLPRSLSIRRGHSRDSGRRASSGSLLAGLEKGLFKSSYQRNSCKWKSFQHAKTAAGHPSQGYTPTRTFDSSLPLGGFIRKITDEIAELRTSGVKRGESSWRAVGHKKLPQRTVPCGLQMAWSAPRTRACEPLLCPHPHPECDNPYCRNASPKRAALSSRSHIARLHGRKTLETQPGWPCSANDPSSCEACERSVEDPKQSTRTSLHLL